METVYIRQTEDDEIFANFKSDINSLIKEAEESEEDLDWKVIASVKPIHVNRDFNPSYIEWYEKGEKSKSFIDKVVLSVIQLLKYQYNG